jgi:Holliday junction resolvase RusA-like endonuclease
MWGWKGKRKFKSTEYLEYQNEIRDTILNIDGDKFEWCFGNSQVCFDIKAGLSNRGADLDNCIKPLLDTYQSMYKEFNDNKVYHITMEKFIVKKGDEYLEVKIEEYVKDYDNKEDIHG